MTNNRNEKEWEKLLEKYKVGDKLVGTVNRIENFGVFLDINSAFEGLILVPCLKYPPVQSSDNFPKIGDKIEAVILGFQEKAELEWRHVALSILEKHLQGDLDWEPE